VSISDLWAAANPGTLALNITTTAGTVSMKDASGNLVAGSGTSAISVSGTLSQLNADLSTLSYTAGSASASVTVDVWDQAGVEATKAIGVTVIPATIMIPATQKSATENVSNATIVATAGNHMIFIGGTNDVVTATGGNETIQAFQGSNTITTGAGNDTLSFAGSTNLINAGPGNNVLQETGSNNMIVLPSGGDGYDDIFGKVLTNGDMFDLRPMLTNWNGNLASIGNFVKLMVNGSSELIKVDPTGVAGGSLYTVAKLEGSGSVSLDALLARSIT
jgi:Ca2+-binding RTX toxin-like protein